MFVQLPSFVLLIVTQYVHSTVTSSLHAGTGCLERVSSPTLRQPKGTAVGTSAFLEGRETLRPCGPSGLSYFWPRRGSWRTTRIGVPSLEPHTDRTQQSYRNTSRRRPQMWDSASCSTTTSSATATCPRGHIRFLERSAGSLKEEDQADVSANNCFAVSQVLDASVYSSKLEASSISLTSENDGTTCYDDEDAKVQGYARRIYLQRLPIASRAKKPLNGPNINIRALSETQKFHLGRAEQSDGSQRVFTRLGPAVLYTCGRQRFSRRPLGRFSLAGRRYHKVIGKSGQACAAAVWPHQNYKQEVDTQEFQIVKDQIVLAA